MREVSVSQFIILDSKSRDLKLRWHRGNNPALIVQFVMANCLMKAGFLFASFADEQGAKVPPNNFLLCRNLNGQDEFFMRAL